MSTASVSPELKLKRFLHYGRESSLYQPGSNFAQKNCDRENVTSMDALLADGKATEAVTLILKAFGDGYSAYSEALVFALAMCAKQPTSKELQEAAYNAVSTICKVPQNLFLFIKFSSSLANPTTGWGRGFKRAMNQWYQKMEPMELAQCVTKYRGCYGWSHRDIIKLAHIKCDDIAKAAILHVVVKGLKDAKKEYGEKSEAQQVLNYIQTIEDFKHCKDEQSAARLIETNSLTPEHLPPHLLKSREVWGALVPHLSLPQLLQNLKRFAQLRFLRGNHQFVTKLLDALSNQTAIAESHLHPAQVLVTLCNYENIAKPANVNPNEEETKVRTPPTPHPKIVEALKLLLTSTFKLLVPTGMRYLVAVDVRSPMVHGKCWHSSNVTPAQAAVLMTLCLVKAERDVTVVAFGTEGSMHEVKLDKQTAMQEAQEKLKEVPNGPVDLTQPLLYAKRLKKPVDVFIMLTDTQVKQGKLKPVKALQQYRTALNLPNAKMVTCGLSSPKFMVACPTDLGMLDIAGFDGHVPRVIEAFSRGAF